MLRDLLPIALIMLSINVSSQKIEGLALTPPMGWNSWNYFGCNVSEELIKETTDAIVSSGMKDAGYVFVNIDDCWQGERDAEGNIQPDPERFPSGMKALADYVHSKGLKLGIYSDAGDKTCGGHPGSRGHEYQDARQYAAWELDYLKYDWCNTDNINAKGAYTTMRDALYDAGRPIVFSICEWGDNEPWKWASEIGHLWRISGDIHHCFDCVIDHGSWKQWGVLQILDLRDNNELRANAGPGHWNDPDMMEVGNGMSLNEDRAHFSMWCMLAAPLLAGNDVRIMSDDIRDILTNKDAISINQDSLGVQGFKYYSSDNIELWFKPLAGGDWAACFLNRDTETKTLEFEWNHWVMKDDLTGLVIDFKKEEFEQFDVWTKKSLGSTAKTLHAELPGHDVLMLRLKSIQD